MYVFSIYRPAISLLYFTSVAIVFFCGFNMIEEEMIFFNQLFNFGLLVSYYNYTVSFFGPVQHLADQLDKLQSGLVALTRTFNLLDMEEKEVERLEQVWRNDFALTYEDRPRLCNLIRRCTLGIGDVEIEPGIMMTMVIIFARDEFQREWIERNVLYEMQDRFAEIAGLDNLMLSVELEEDTPSAEK